MALVDKIKQGFQTSGDTGAHKYLMVPIVMFFALLIFVPTGSSFLLVYCKVLGLELSGNCFTFLKFCISDSL